MSGSHLHAGHGAVASSAHRVDAAVKLACLGAFLAAVVSTPPRAVWAFGVYAVVVATAAASARLPVRVLARRIVVEAPFVVFAGALPFLGTGERTTLFGLSVSVAGCWAAWAILAKATLGASATIVVAWSTPVADLLRGLQRLRVPAVLVAIAGLMVRYLDVVAGDLRRLQVARVSRGDDPRWLWQGRAVAATAGTVFVRSFERGERVHRAMLARGFTGRFPDTTPPARLVWFPAIAWPAVAWAVATAALVTR